MKYIVEFIFIIGLFCVAFGPILLFKVNCVDACYRYQSGFLGKTDKLIVDCNHNYDVIDKSCAYVWRWTK